MIEVILVAIFLTQIAIIGLLVQVALILRESHRNLIRHLKGRGALKDIDPQPRIHLVC